MHCKHNGGDKNRYVYKFLAIHQKNTYKTLIVSIIMLTVLQQVKIQCQIKFNTFRATSCSSFRFKDSSGWYLILNLRIKIIISSIRLYLDGSFSVKRKTTVCLLTLQLIVYLNLSILVGLNNSIVLKCQKKMGPPFAQNTPVW